MKITSDSFNPVLIKELRQHFHGKLFLVTMGLLLLAELSILFLICANYASPTKPMDDVAGPMLTAGVLVTFGIACLLLCGGITIFRFAEERSNPELDFTRFCAMSPLKIIWGKMLSSYAIAVYLLSLCLPFLVIAYFLRGISIADIGVCILFIVIATLFVIQTSLFVGTIGKKVLVSLLTFCGIWAGFGFIGILTVIVHAINGSTTNVPVFLAMIIFASLAVLGFIFVLNLAMLSAPFANRTMPARIYIIAIALLSPFVGYCICYIDDPPISIMKAMPTVLLTMLTATSCLCSFIAAFERSVIGPRVQMQCPQTPLKRFFFFLISSGSGGGITLAWILLLLALAVAIVTPVFTPTSTFSHWTNDSFKILSFGFASLLYTQIALCVHKRFKIMPIVAWLLTTVILVFVPVFLFSILSFSFNDSTDFVILLVTTPFFLTSLDDNSLTIKDFAIFIGPFLSVIGCAFAFSHIREQFKSLRQSSES